MKSNEKKYNIWLCDLTYTQQTIASDVMPNAIGGIASYCGKEFGNEVNFELVKRPEELAEWFETRSLPQVIGFSNYAWNEALSRHFARKIKTVFPKIIIVMGGPNYPLNLEERERFFRNSYCDFYIVKEAEVAFTNLISKLIRTNFNTELIKESIPSIDYIDNKGNFVPYTKYARRIQNLEEIPSSYTTGSLDRFFDGSWLPIIQTNRGCPFSCTFCVEGNAFYTKVYKSGSERVKEELGYIAEKMNAIKGQKRFDLHIADSNFGMYPEDVETAQFISKLQENYGYPEYINVATGKNKKERVLQIAKLVNGALRLSGSIQSLDHHVLKNIKRSNINLDDLIQLSLEAKQIGANSYSEIILGLPGDSITAHFESIKKIMDAKFNIVCLYQLMLLPGTDMGSNESRSRFGFKTAFRVIPRCYGTYHFLGEEISIAEIEEIVVSNNDITFEEYLDARFMHLVINTFYNDGVYKDIFPLLTLLKIPKYEWLKKIHEFKSSKFNELRNVFIEETKSELWETYEDLYVFTSDPKHINKFFSGDIGSNLIFKYKLVSITEYTETLYEVAYLTLKELIEEKGKTEYLAVSKEVLRFCTNKMKSLFDLNKRIINDYFSFDVEKLTRDKDYEKWRNYCLNEPEALQFFRTEEQFNLLNRYIKIYGNNITGLSRIIAKVYVGRLLRHTQKTILSKKDKLNLSFGQSKMTGLNPFV